MKTAVILAAGKSTRTYPLTLTRPKPTLPLVGRPLMGHTLAALAGVVEEAVVVVNYRAAMVRAAFGSSYEGLPIKYVEQREPRGTGDAVAAVRDVVDGPFLVVDGDDYFGAANFPAVAAARGAAVLGAPVKEGGRFGALATEGGRLVRLDEKPAAGGPALANAGAYKLTPDIFDYLGRLEPSPRGELELTAALVAYAADYAVAVVKAPAAWLAVATATDLLAAQVLLWPFREDALTGEGCVVSDDAQLGGRTALGARCEVGPRALVEASLLLDGVKVGAGASVTGCVLGEGVTAGPGARLDGAVVGDGASVGPGAVVEPGARIWPGLTVPAGATAAGEVK
jgi:NDP-sugar pyrophosphorylase family protein